MNGYDEQAMCHDSDIPDTVLDTAIDWAVTLYSGKASDADRRAFDDWLAADPLHYSAWQRLKSVEDEFVPARQAGRAREALDRAARRRDRKRRYQLLGGVLSALAVVGLVLNPGHHAHWGADYSTGTGERQRIALPGGGELHLNAGTLADIDRGTGRDIVRLYQGELYIDSTGAPAGAKPQVVTDDGRLVPTGTRFVVASTTAGTELTVTDGSVAMLGPGKGDGRSDDPLAVGRVGQQWRLHDGRASPSPPSGLRPDAWMDGIVEADNATLGQVLDALARHREGWLHYDSAAAGLRVTGVFRLDDTDSALRALVQTLPIRVRRLTGWWVKVEAAGNPG